MKRFCLDICILMMGLFCLLCVGAIPEGELPLLPLLATIIGLCCCIRLAYAYTQHLDAQATAAKRAKRQQALRAKQRATRTAAACPCAAQAAPAAQRSPDLYVA